MMTLSSAASRSVLAALLLGFGSATACIDESLIENEKCLSDADCFSSQECIKTAYQDFLEEDVGWCRPEGEGCAIGIQPGCNCEIDGNDGCCSSSGGEGLLAPHIDSSSGICSCVASDEANEDFLPETNGSGNPLTCTSVGA